MIIRSRRPSLWIHGHTHESRDYRLGATRIVANPCGYPGALNRSFSSIVVTPNGWWREVSG
jgi:Icc-related predicted phosphoesterase